MDLFILLASIGCHAYFLARANVEYRLFLGTLLLSHVYFCLGGYYYWISLKGGYFVGFYWDEDLLWRSIVVLSLSTTAVAAMVAFLNSTQVVDRPEVRPDLARSIPDPPVVMIFLLIGIVASIFVLSVGIDIDFRQRNPFLLIAYQFSDLVIPVIVFLVARHGITKLNLSLLLGFCIYASLVGFRYKIALVFIPLGGLLAFARMPTGIKLVWLSMLATAAILMFGLLTIYRNKFGIPDLSRPIDNLAYGIFADTNVVYGLTTILTNYADTGNYYYVQPLIDTVREWVPHVIDPTRVTGEYLAPMQYGFETAEGVHSGTAYPFLGEFAVMAGWYGVVIGVILYGAGYIALHKMVIRRAATLELAVGGLGILASIVGYYHYSRGYFPQATKSYIFIIFPYMYMCVQHMNAEYRSYRYFQVETGPS